jgi:hypothetical protein
MPEMAEMAEKGLKITEKPSEYRATITIPSGERIDFMVKRGFLEPAIGREEDYWLFFHLKRGTNQRLLFHVNCKRARARRSWLLDPRSWAARRAIRTLYR